MTIKSTDSQIDQQIKQFEHHHMQIPWHDIMTSDNYTPAAKSTLVDRSLIVGRIGLMLLSCGTGAWRVRDSMNIAARQLKMTCSAEIGLTSIEYTCMDEHQSYSQSLSLASTGVNTSKLAKLESFMKMFEERGGEMTIGEIHNTLSKIAKTKGY